jgi:hypothetical protein
MCEDSMKNVDTPRLLKEMSPPRIGGVPAPGRPVRSSIAARAKSLTSAIQCTPS